MTTITKITGSHTDPIREVLWEGPDEEADLMIKLIIPFGYYPGGLAGFPYYSVRRTMVMESGDEMFSGTAYVKMI